MDIFPSAAIRTWEMDPSGKIKKETSICVIVAADFENGRLGCLCLETKETFYV